MTTSILRAVPRYPARTIETEMAIDFLALRYIRAKYLDVGCNTPT